jgi:hypothetical protein
MLQCVGWRLSVSIQGPSRISRDEMQAWLQDVLLPYDVGEGECFCSEQMWMSEESPQQANYYCAEAGVEGDLHYRSLCNVDGFALHHIGLPADRVASCFEIEHQVGYTQFRIVDHVAGGVAVYSGDGSNIGGLVLDPAGVARAYDLQLDRAASSPDAAVTIRYVAHPGHGSDPGDPGDPGECFCSDDMWASEQAPQGTNEPCDTTEGNLVYRSACNVDGFDVHAISMPAGRVAGCFAMEYTQGTVWFHIIQESDMSVMYEGDGTGADFSSLRLGLMAATRST